MVGVFAEFGIEIPKESRSVIKECVDLMLQLGGDIRIIEKRMVDTVSVIYKTRCSNVDYLEEKSEELCDKLEPFAKDFQAFFQKESDKIIYKCIFFVRTTFKENPVIKINKRLLKLAYMLQTEIHFDLFE